jgi:hypothetical protein
MLSEIQRKSGGMEVEVEMITKMKNLLEAEVLEEVRDLVDDMVYS